jgi:hypothetical protein
MHQHQGSQQQHGRTSGTAGTPETAGVLATEGTLSAAGTQATEMMQAGTVKQTAAEMPETVLTLTPCKFPGQYTKNSAERKIHEKTQRKRVKIALSFPLEFSQSDSYRTIGSSMLLVQ